MAETKAGRISLEDFVLEMMHVPARELRLPRLVDLFHRLDLSEMLVREHIFFSRDAYARNLVCRTPRFDMLVLCWRPGQITTIHDHVDSLNVTRCFEGRLTSRTFEIQDRPSEDRALVRLASEEIVGKDSLSTVDLGGIHQLANTSGEDLVTVHVYAPPLKDITVYYPNSGKFERVALRYTLEDEFA